MATTVEQVQAQVAISEQWAVTAAADSTDALSWHGSHGAAAKVASAVPTYCVRKLGITVVEDPPATFTDTITASETYAQTDAAFWSYGE